MMNIIVGSLYFQNSEKEVIFPPIFLFNSSPFYPHKTLTGLSNYIGKSLRRIVANVVLTSIVETTVTTKVTGTTA